MKIKKTKKEIGIAVLWVMVLVLLDQITKILADTFLQGKPDFVLIPEVFVLRYLRNDSAAFSLDPITLLNNIFHFEVFANDPVAFLNAKMLFFIVMTIGVILLFCILYVKIPNSRHFRYLNWILIGFIAGAIGNCIDRAVYHYVIDFFYFELINFPIFNVADIYVTVSAFATVILCLFYYKEADYDQIFPAKKSKKKDSFS